MLETNLLGVFRCTKVAAPALTAANGAIVNTASIAGLGRAGSSLASRNGSNRSNARC
jgi:3-oxoacyl-[acyl-carrier protein] reductase